MIATARITMDESASDMSTLIPVEFDYLADSFGLPPEAIGALQYSVIEPDYLEKRFGPQPLVTSTGRKGARVNYIFVLFLLAVFNLVYLRADKIASFFIFFYLNWRIKKINFELNLMHSRFRNK